MLKLIVISILLFFSIAEAHADFESGNKLFSQCGKEDDTVPFSVCIGYVIGTTDMILEMQRVAGIKQLLCLPSGVTTGQEIDVVSQYLERFPEKRHFSAADLVLNALVSAFPCSSRK